MYLHKIHVNCDGWDIYGFLKFFPQKEAMSTSFHRLTLSQKLLIFPHWSEISDVPAGCEGKKEWNIGTI